MADERNPDDDARLDENENRDLELDGWHDTAIGQDLDFASVFVLCARQPFEDWARGIEGHGPDWTLQPIDRCSAVVTPELPRQVDADEWIRHHYAGMFERQLETWTMDEAQWPSDRSFDTFLAWFDVVFAPNIDDMRDAERPLRPATCDPLSLRRVLAEFLQLPADGSLYVDISTGELFAWTDDELTAIHAGDAEDFGVPADEMRELQEVFASESLVEIAHRADMDNPGTMFAFARAVESPTIQNRLLGALQAKKAARRFAEAVDVAGLRHRWSAWLEHEAAEILRESLEARGVPFVDDLEAEPGGSP
jgi:hypothetical protein